MTGPEQGHNIIPFWQHYSHHQEHKLEFLSRKGVAFSHRREGVEYLNYRGRPFQLPKLMNHWDWVWVQGGFDWRLWLALELMKPATCSLCVTLWGEQLPQEALSGSWRGQIYRWLLRKADLVHCNWYGTADILSQLDLKNLWVQHWGMNREFLASEDRVDSIEGMRFIESLDPKLYKFFYPKSILSVSGHDLVIKACAELLDRGVENFKVYFWSGNVVDPELEEKCRFDVESLGLAQHIEFVKMGFLSYQEMRTIWSKMNAGLQIAKKDQLSTTLLEPMALGLPVIASRIGPYRRFEQKYGVQLGLVPLHESSLAKAMEKLIREGHRDTTDLESLKSIVHRDFDFSKNVEQINSQLEGLSKAV